MPVDSYSLIILMKFWERAFFSQIAEFRKFVYTMTCYQLYLSYIRTYTI